jgi:glycerol-3-phosphate dehydrogenase (NAD(P)+)
LVWGIQLKAIYEEAKQTIEGFRTIEAMHDLAVLYNIELPMIQATYQIIKNQISVKEALLMLLSRDLKSEDF